MIQNPAAAVPAPHLVRPCSPGIALGLRLVGMVLLVVSLLAVDSLPPLAWALLLLPAGAGLWLCLLSLHLRGHKLRDVMDLGPLRWYP